MSLCLSASPEAEFVTATPRALLRVEGAALGLGAVALYAAGGHSWLAFAALFLAPDLGFAAYLAGPRVGATVYNALHWTAPRWRWRLSAGRRHRRALSPWR
jgi:hypothetical protein